MSTPSGVPNTIPFDRTPPPVTDPYLAWVHETSTAQIAELHRQLAEIRSHDLKKDADEEKASNKSWIRRLGKRLDGWRQLLVFAVFMLTGAGTTLVAVRGYAATFVEDTVTEGHSRAEDPIEPSVTSVSEVKKDLTRTRSGVRTLVLSQKQQDEVRQLEATLKPYQQRHEESMQEWAAKKARLGDRAPEKPKKTDRHLQLEHDLQTLLQAGRVDYDSVLDQLDEPPGLKGNAP